MGHYNISNRALFLKNILQLNNLFLIIEQKIPLKYTICASLCFYTLYALHSTKVAWLIAGFQILAQNIANPHLSLDAIDLFSVSHTDTYKIRHFPLGNFLRDCHFSSVQPSNLLTGWMNVADVHTPYNVGLVRNLSLLALKLLLRQPTPTANQAQSPLPGEGSNVCHSLLNQYIAGRIRKTGNYWE